MKNEYEVRGGTTAIFLSRRDGTRLETLIDTCDLMVAASIKGGWHARLDHCGCGYYVGSNFGPRRATIQLHRWLSNPPSGKVVDHINHDTLDNRRVNLRVVSGTVNMLNRRLQRNNKSGAPGVHFHRASSRWIARVKRNGRPAFERSYVSFDEAVAAREAAYATVFAAALQDDGIAA